MSTQDIVQKLWNLCNILRDDGITYHQYVTELTYILFLKMINETGTEEKLIEAVKEMIKKLDDEQKSQFKELGEYSWAHFTKLEGLDLKKYYNKLLTQLGSAPLNEISRIYVKAVSSIDEPRNLKRSSPKSTSWIGTTPNPKAWAICMKAFCKRMLTKRNLARDSISRPAC